MTEKSSPPTAGKRWRKMAGMTTRVATRYAGHQLKKPFLSDTAKAEAERRLHSRNGEQIAETLGELKGAVMKIGQLAGQVADVLPAELADTLRVLQREAPPMPFSAIEDQITAEFGKPTAELFAHFNKEAFAAASIGQVHRATLHDGREVIVKVQYPGVAESVDSDMRQLKRAIRVGRLVRLRKEVLDGLFAEIRARILEELDYERELTTLSEFRAFFASYPFIVMPEPIAELSSARVLTLSYEEGDHLNELGDKNYDQATRNQIAETLFRFFSAQLFELGAVHADPHAGNFAYRSDGTVVMYDFGCVKRLSPEVTGHYRQLVEAALKPDYDAVDKQLEAIGSRVPGTYSPGPEFYASWRNLLLEAFLDDNAYDFGNTTLHSRATARSRELFKMAEFLQPSVETTFVDRMVGGHYWTMVNLQANVAFRPLLQEALAKSRF